MRVLEMKGLASSAKEVEVMDLEEGGSLEAVEKFLFSGTEIAGLHAVKPAVLPLVGDILRTAAAAHAPAEPVTAAVVTRKGADTQETLAKGVVGWVQGAENDLADSVSKLQRATPEWYQLLYKIDDVSVKLKMLVDSTFLRRSEHAWLILRGRMQGAGLPNVFELTGTNLAEGKDKVLTHISTLHLAAQKALGKFLLLSGSGGALSGLIWASGYGIYESGSIGAVMTTVGAWGMVNRWGVAKGEFVKGVEETGKGVVEAEGRQMWGVVKRGGKAQEEVVREEECRKRKEIEEGVEAFKAVEGGVRKD